MKIKEKINLAPYEPLINNILRDINILFFCDIHIKDIRDTAVQFNLFNMCATDVKDSIIDESCKRLINKGFNVTIPENERNYYTNKYIF